MIQIRVHLLAINHTNIHIHTHVCIHTGKTDTYIHTYIHTYIQEENHQELLPFSKYGFPLKNVSVFDHS